MIQLTLPGYIIAGSVYALYHAVAALIAPDGPWRVIGRPAAHTLAEALRFSFPFGGVPLAIARHLPGRRSVPRHRPRRRRDPDHVGGVPARLRPRRPRPPASRRSPDVPPGHRARRSAPSAFLAVAGRRRPVVRRPDGPTHRRDAEHRRRAGRRRAGHQRARGPVGARDRTPPRGDAVASPTTPTLDLVVWPENTIDVDDVRRLADARGRSPPRPPGSARRSPSASPRTSADGSSTSPTPRSWSTPDGEVVDRYDKVRRVPVRRVRAAARPARSARGARRPGRPRRRRRHRAGGPRTARRHRSSAVVDLVGGVLRRPGPRRRRSSAAEAILNPTNGASYTGTIVQTQQVASSRLRAVENGRWVVQAAPTGFTAVDRRRRRRARAHVDQRAAGRVRRHRAAHRAHLVHEHRRRADHRRADRRPAGVDVVRRRLAGLRTAGRGRRRSHVEQDA